jgi:hypothetical protein
MTDRELMQQALDALEEVNSKGYQSCWKGAFNPEIKLLRARLAQPEPEPMAYSDIVSDGGLDPRNKFDTAPPQREWKNLTSAEIKVLWMAANNKAEFADLLQSKLREKNT